MKHLIKPGLFLNVLSWHLFFNSTIKGERQGGRYEVKSHWNRTIHNIHTLYTHTHIHRTPTHHTAHTHKHHTHISHTPHTQTTHIHMLSLKHWWINNSEVHSASIGCSLIGNRLSYPHRFLGQSSSLVGLLVMTSFPFLSHHDQCSMQRCPFIHKSGNWGQIYSHKDQHALGDYCVPRTFQDVWSSPTAARYSNYLLTQQMEKLNLRKIFF